TRHRTQLHGCESHRSRCTAGSAGGLAAPCTQERCPHAMSLRDLAHRSARLPTLGNHLLALLGAPLTTRTPRLPVVLGFHRSSPPQGMIATRENRERNPQNLDGADRAVTIQTRIRLK